MKKIMLSMGYYQYSVYQDQYQYIVNIVNCLINS